MNEKVLLFDFDGTIADSMTSIVEIFNELADRYKLPKKIKKEDIPHLRQLHLHEVIKEFNIPPLRIPFLLYSGRKLFAQQINTLRPIDGIQHVLPALKNLGVRLGIVTSNTKDNVETFLSKNNLELFDFIHSEKGLFGKANILKNVMKTCNLSSENTYYVGDEIRDIEAAHKAGLKIISVTWGANAKESLEKYHPDFIIDTPSQLLKLEE